MKKRLYFFYRRKTTSFKKKLEYFEKSVQARFFKMKLNFRARQGSGSTRLSPLRKIKNVKFSFKYKKFF